MATTVKRRKVGESSNQVQERLQALATQISTSSDDPVKVMQDCFSVMKATTTAPFKDDPEKLLIYDSYNLSIKKYVTNRKDLEGEYPWKQLAQAESCFALKDFNDDLMAARLSVNPQKCCAFFCDLAQGLDVGDAGKGKLHLANMKFGGGFKDTYSPVNVLPGDTSGQEQSRSIFALRSREIRTLMSKMPSFKALIVQLEEQLYLQGLSFKWEDANGPGLEPIQLEELHFLFGFSAHTHFLYHRDQITMQSKQVFGYLSVILNLTPCESSFRVANSKEPFQFTGIGSTAVFPSRLWHRSEKAQSGTVKVALFYSKKSGSDRPGNSSEQDIDAKPAKETGFENTLLGKIDPTPTSEDHADKKQKEVAK